MTTQGLYGPLRSPCSKSPPQAPRSCPGTPVLWPCCSRARHRPVLTPMPNISCSSAVHGSSLAHKLLSASSNLVSCCAAVGCCMPRSVIVLMFGTESSCSCVSCASPLLTQLSHAWSISRLASCDSWCSGATVSAPQNRQLSSHRRCNLLQQHTTASTSCCCHLTDASFTKH